MDTLTPNPLPLVVNSPQELADRFKETPSNNPFISLVISSPKVLVRTFQFKELPLAELKPRLQSQAVELLSLPFSQIEFDYQILDSNSDKVSGVYISMAHREIREYLGVLDRVKRIPVKMTALILATTEAFCQTHDLPTGRVCLLDLSHPNKIDLAIFLNKQCESLREIPYDTLDEARVEIIQTLRSAVAASSVKEFETIYCAGDWGGKEEIIRQIEKMFHTKIEQGIRIDVTAALAGAKGLFDVNLLKGYSFSLKEREQTLSAATVVLTGLLVVFVGLLACCVFNCVQIQQIKSSYKAADLDRAKMLEKQLKAIK